MSEKATIADKIALNSMFVTASAVVVGVISFLLIPFIISKIGLQKYGVYLVFVLFSYKGVLSVFTLGLQELTIKLVAQRDRVKETVSTIIFLNVVFGCMFTFILLFMSELLADSFKVYASLKTYFELLVLSSVFQFLIVIFKAVLSGYQEFKYLKVYEIIISAFNAVVVVFFLIVYPSVETIIVIFVCMIFVEFVILFSYLYFIKKIISSRHIDFTVVKQNISVWKNYFLMKLSSTLSSQGDRLLIASVLTPSSLAFYEIVAKLPNFLKNVFSIVNQVVLPEASRISKHEKKSKQIALYQRGVNLLFFVSFPIILFFQFNAENFLYLWVGQEFVHLSMLLQIYLIWNISTLIVTFGWSIMFGAGENLSLLTRISFSTFFLKIFLLIVFVYLYDLLGVIIATVTSLSIAAAYLMYVYSSYFKISFLQSLLNLTKILLIIYAVFYGVASVIPIYIGWESLIFQALLSLSTVWFALYFLYLNSENKSYLSYLWRKIILNKIFKSYQNKD